MSRTKLLFTFIAGLAVAGIILWFGGAAWIGRSVLNNLWSVQYLWQQSDHPLANYLPEMTQPPTHHSGYLWQARAQVARGNWRQAEMMLQPLADTTNGAISRDLQSLQAEIAAGRGDTSSAIARWQQIGATDELLAFARQLSERGNVDAATQAYLAAYGLGDERAILPFARFLAQSKGDEASAETLLREHIAALPSSRYALSWLRELGTIYRQQKAWSAAQAVYQQVVTVAPDSTNDWVQLGWSYYEQRGDVEQAIAQFQQAITVDPQAGAGYYAMASLLSREQVYDEADSWYQQALAREPEQPWWWLSRANSLQQAGKQTMALQVYATIAEQFPEFAPGHYTAAWAYRRADERAAAVAAITAATALLDPARDSVAMQSDYYARAGQIYEWAGHVQEALTAYTKAQRLEPTRNDVAEGLERLR